MQLPFKILFGKRKFSNSKRLRHGTHGAFGKVVQLVLLVAPLIWVHLVHVRQRLQNYSVMYHIHKTAPRNYKVNIQIPVKPIRTVVITPLIPFVSNVRYTFGGWWDSETPKPDRRRTRGGDGYSPQIRATVR